MAAKPISQSDTRWVKKEGKRGYVEQVSTGKRVTGRVALVKNTTKGKAGTTQRYKAGTGLKQTGKAKPKGGRNSTSSTDSDSGPSAAEKTAAAAAKAKAVANATRRNEVGAGGRMRAQNSATAASAPSVAAAKKKAANLSARNKRISARATERSSERKAAIERGKRPSLRGAYNNVNSYGDKTVADFVKWSAKTSNAGYKAISDYFR